MGGKQCGPRLNLHLLRALESFQAAGKKPQGEKEIIKLLVIEDDRNIVEAK
jgi:hypothetical protein